MTEWGPNLICLAALFCGLFLNIAFGPVDKPGEPIQRARSRQRLP